MAENLTTQGALEEKLRRDDALQDKLGQQKEQLQALACQHQDADYLRALIGAHDGAKFRNYAQGVTLDLLVELSNQQLNQIDGRYQLQRQTEGKAHQLELMIVDTWQANVLRGVNTLSGGESFLVSLALALALSDLVSHKTSVDSLFLDEGFGTLDQHTLEVALDALDQVHASGKMIGMISHVEAMKQRIPTQIKVFKQNGLGISYLDKQFRVRCAVD